MTFSEKVFTNNNLFLTYYSGRVSRALRVRRLQKPMTLGHARASTVAALAYRVLSTR